jgi:hypothetical protein
MVRDATSLAIVATLMKERLPAAGTEFTFDVTTPPECQARS